MFSLLGWVVFDLKPVVAVAGFTCIATRWEILVFYTNSDLVILCSYCYRSMGEFPSHDQHSRYFSAYCMQMKVTPKAMI